MEYRTQTYLGALQLLAVVSGYLFLRAAVEGIDDMLDLDPMFDPLRPVRGIDRFGWILVVVPILWILFTIRADRLESRWANRSFVLASGLVILVLLAALFLWGGAVALNTLAPLGGWW